MNSRDKGFKIFGGKYVGRISFVALTSVFFNLGRKI